MSSSFRKVDLTKRQQLDWMFVEIVQVHGGFSPRVQNPL